MNVGPKTVPCLIVDMGVCIYGWDLTLFELRRTLGRQLYFPILHIPNDIHIIRRQLLVPIQSYPVIIA